MHAPVLSLAVMAIVFPAMQTSSPKADDNPAPSGEKARRRPATAQEALLYFRKQDWAKAAQAFEIVVRENPNNGEHWHNYAFALHALKRYDEAIQAWNKSIQLGFQSATGMYNIGCANALKGQKDEALGWLEKALAAGFAQEGLLSTDSDLDSLRGEARFKKLLGAPPEGLSREQRWSYDLDHLVRRMEKVHYSLYARVSRDKLHAAVDDVKRRIPDLKDEEMAVGVQSILAMVGDGHTTMDWESRHGGKAVRPRYPIQLYEYKEGLFIRGAEPALANLAGARVLRIGTVSAEEALKAAAPLCSHDNAMGIKIQAPMYLTDPAVLTYLKLADSMSGVTIVVKKSNGEEATVELKPKVVSEQDEKKFVLANATAKSPEPLSFKKNDERFWFEYVPERKMVYFQFNAVANKPGETLEAFCGRMFSFINEKSVEYLVIDMRNNGGGNNYLNRALVHGLIRCDKVNRSGHLFVLVGRRTFSAAMNGSVDIERNAQALFVGEPTGSSPNFVGETTILVLPCSGLRLSCSSLYWQSSTATDRRPWIAPDLVAEPSIMAFSANRDPGLEAIFGYIDSVPVATSASRNQ